MLLENYTVDGFYDEMVSSDGSIRPGYKQFIDKINSLDSNEILHRQQAAERAFMFMGVTFNVYTEGEGVGEDFSVRYHPADHQS